MTHRLHYWNGWTYDHWQLANIDWQVSNAHTQQGSQFSVKQRMLFSTSLAMVGDMSRQFMICHDKQYLSPDVIKLLPDIIICREMSPC